MSTQNQSGVEAEARQILAKLNRNGVLSRAIQESLTDRHDHVYENIDDLFCDLV